ncbi:MAG: hypothetical protein AAGF94_18375 [Pseudomonadota bacterium]
MAIFKDALTAAGLPSFGPNSIRDTLAELGQRVCRSPEEFKAWSQNLGHEDVLVTFRSYGAVAAGRQMEIIARMRDPGDGKLNPVDRPASL